jgi:serine/threonine-protein kinase
MASQAKSEIQTAGVEERKLIAALVSRGLVTREEIDESKKTRTPGEVGPRELLKHLVKAGFLTPNQARRAHKDLESLLEQQIPGYELIETLGQGSMGMVYKARQLAMDRLVAIKVLKPKLASNPGYVDRFQREARIAAKLNSNNVIQALDFGSAGKLNYFVMEYVEGTNVKQELETGKVYPEREAVQITLQIAQALHHAHGRGMLHRDIKPANIVLMRDGVAKLADLGLSRHIEDEKLDESEKGLTVGTPYYVAPELINGRAPPDIRSDIYSLGATMYHMVTGGPPFPSTKVPEVLRGHLYGKPIPPDRLNPSLSAGLSEVIDMMMAKDREQRYQAPADLVLDLECLLRHEPPRLARQRSQFSALEGLATGQVELPEATVDEDTSTQQQASSIERSPLRLWLAVLALLLALSFVLNLALLAGK